MRRLLLCPAGLDLPGPFAGRRNIADFLDIPHERPYVVRECREGGFGSSQETSITRGGAAHAVNTLGVRVAADKAMGVLSGVTTDVKDEAS